MGNENFDQRNRSTARTRFRRVRTLRLRMERLECRYLLAGLNVSVYVDHNLSGSFDAAYDLPAANRLVYIDLNNSGNFEVEEPVALTNQLGDAQFPELESGDYSVGLLTNESFQRLVDPVAVSPPSSQSVSSDLQRLANTEVPGSNSVLNSIQATRQLDFIVELENQQKFVGAKNLGGLTVLELIDFQAGLLDSLVISGTSGSLKADRFLGRVALTTDEATHVASISGDSLELDAILADAMAPVALSHNKLVSVDRSDSGGWIVWDTGNWLPVERRKLANNPILDLAISQDGTSVQALTEGLVHTSQWIGTTARARVADGEGVANIRMGVQVNDDRSPIPEVIIPIRIAHENDDDQFELRPIVGGSTEGTDLWFAIGNDASNGQLSVDIEGNVQYSADTGFVGQDQALIQVYDGVSTSQLIIRWDVKETNRPPTGIIINLQDLPENSPVGSEIGFVTVIDPNSGASYRVTTSDSRFRVENGRVILDGAVDFESEPLITLEFVAIDDQETFSITATASLSVVNSVEPPTGILLSNLSVDERKTNVVVGRISILNPDQDADYVVSVSDSRFEVQGEQLILLESLNRQNGDSLTLTIQVTDRNFPDVSFEQEFTLAVNPVFDAPQDIVITSLQVPELTPGGVVGRLVAVGLDEGDQARFDVSDDRFEVLDGVLKLRSDAEVFRSAETQIVVAVTATGLSGAALTVSFPLIVVPPRSPWQNPFTPTDVNGDGRVSAIDVLQVINYLNHHGSGPVSPPSGSGGSGEPPPFHPDVNGDGRVTALDALLIINILNARASGNAQTGNGENDSGLTPEGEPEAFFESRSQTDLFSVTGESEATRKKNMQIDSELELLLDQLAVDSRRH